MFLTASFVLLLADTSATALDSWVPRRMAQLRIPAVAVAVTAPNHSAWTWSSGVESVLTRRPVTDKTVWPVSAAAADAAHVSASPHASLAAILPPSLIVFSVWGVVLWVLLIPLSLLVRKRWRFGRWHEILAVLLAAPITWIYLRRLGGPVLASWLTATGGATLLIPLFLAALAWGKSRVASLVILAAYVTLVWSARHTVLPIPRFGASDAGATTTALRDYLASALQSDSLELTRRGFTLDGGRWTRDDSGRGATTLFVLVPASGTGVVAVANAGVSETLLKEIVDSITP